MHSFARNGKRRRPGFDRLEDRAAPAIDFTSAFGLAVSGVTSDLDVNAVAQSAAGDVFIAGSFKGSMSFDPNSTASVKASSGSRDAFVAAYSSTNTLRWVSIFSGSGGSATGQASAIGLDSTGQLYVTGSFSGSVDFDPGTGTSSLSSPARTDVFIARLDANGGLLWARDVAGTTSSVDQGLALAVDSTRGVLVTGGYSGSATFGTTTLNSVGATEAFVTKLDPAGNFLWAVGTRGSGSSSSEMHGLAVDSLGNAYAAGFLSGSADFDPGSSTTSHSAVALRDVAVWSLDASGGLRWAIAVGGSDLDQAQAIALDPSGGLYVAGSYTGTVDFDPGPGLATLTGLGLYDPFVLKLTTAGTFVWARGLNESADAAGEATALAVDSVGRPMIAGWFNGTIDLDPGLAVSNRISSGSADMFVLTLDQNGGYSDARTGGGANFDAAFGVARNASGRVVTAGATRGPARFGTTDLALAGVSQLFVATLQITDVPTAPNAPVLDPASDSGSSSSDGVTSKQSLTFSLSGIDPASTATLLRDGTVVASRTGNGKVTDSGPVGDGLHTYTVIQTSSGGIPSPASSNTVVTVDTLPPAKPNGLAIEVSDDTGTLGDGTTSNTRPRLGGLAEPGATLQLKTAAGALLASAIAGLDGKFTLRPSTTLTDGDYSVLVTATDPAGNASPPSAIFLLRIDTTAPAPPTSPALVLADDSGITGDQRTNVAVPRLAGTVEAGSSVRLLDGQGIVLANGSADSSGAYLLAISAPLADGTYNLSVDATDVAGNRGNPSTPRSLVIDRTAPTAPAAPGLLPADDSGVPGDSITNIARPRLVGVTEAGATISLINNSGAILATATADAQGGYVIAPSNALADGTVLLRVRAMDVAGNQSIAGAAFSLQIDTASPAAPGAPVLVAGDDSGTLGDAITNVNRPRISGTVEPGATVHLVDVSGTQLALVQASGTGEVLLQPAFSFPDGSISLRLVLTDAAGNASQPGTLVIVVIDTQAPAAPSAPSLLLTDDSGLQGDLITSKRRPTLAGSAEANASVRLIDSNGSTLGTGGVNGTGVYQVAPAASLPEGTSALRAVAVDVAGNVSQASLATSLLIDATPPAAPRNLNLPLLDDSGAIGDGLTNVRQPRIRGQAEPGSSVTGTGVGTPVVVTAGSDGWFQIQPTSALSDGTYFLTATATDVAGNTSVASIALNLQILATPPTSPFITLLPADDTGVLGDGVTAQRQPRVIGITVAGGLVELLDASGTLIGTATAANDGRFTVTPTTGLAVGRTSLRVRVRDTAGNQGAPGPALTITIIAPVGDFDGVGVSELSTFQNSTATWATLRPGAAVATSKQFGWAGVDRPITGDFDGDRKADYAVFRPTTAEWYILGSLTGTLTVRQFGWAGVDLPVSADYDGDGKTDLAVYRPTDAKWYVLASSNATLRVIDFGWAGVDLPMPADYDGDGKDDIAVYRPTDARWFIQQSSNSQTLVKQFGWEGVDLPIPMDFDGDGKADLAVYRPPTAEWFLQSSKTGSTTRSQFGWAGVDQPVPADYDGDGKTDLAVFRPTSAEFYVLPSSTGVLQRTTVGTPGSLTGLLRPQVFRLNGLKPQLAVPPAALRVGVPAAASSSNQASLVSTRAPAKLPPHRPIVRPHYRPVQHLPRVPAPAHKVIRNRFKSRNGARHP